MPSTFHGYLAIGVRRSGLNFPINITWKSVEIVTPNGERRRAADGGNILEPGGSLKCTAALVPSDGTSQFTAAAYQIRVNVEKSAQSLMLSDGTTSWIGRFVSEAETSVLLAERPATPGEQRGQLLLEGGAALDRGDAAGALVSYGQLLRLDASDRYARFGVGLAYFSLGRFREALVAFEALAPKADGSWTPVRVNLAETYLALGMENKANALFGPNADPGHAEKLLKKMREALHNRGWSSDVPIPHGGDVDADGGVDCTGSGHSEAELREASWADRFRRSRRCRP